MDEFRHHGFCVSCALRADRLDERYELHARRAIMCCGCGAWVVLYKLFVDGDYYMCCPADEAMDIYTRLYGQDAA